MGPYNTTFQTSDSYETISVFSWNVTHKDFIKEYIEKGYTENWLVWEHRLPAIKSKLSESNADIICLQEIDKELFDEDIGSYFHQQHGYTVKCNYHQNQKHKNGKNKVVFSQAIMFKS